MVVVVVVVMVMVALPAVVVAVEAVVVDGNWDRAQFLELVEQEGPLLADRAEQHMTARELEFRQKLSGQGGWRSSGGSSLGNASGYSEKGSDKKGRKGKDSGKGKGTKGSQQQSSQA